MGWELSRRVWRCWQKVLDTLVVQGQAMGIMLEMFLIGGCSVHISDPQLQLSKPTPRSRIHQQLALERNELVPN